MVFTSDNDLIESQFLDDWGLVILTAQQRHDLLEIQEDRYGSRVTIFTNQLPFNT